MYCNNAFKLQSNFNFINVLIIQFSSHLLWVYPLLTSLISSNSRAVRVLVQEVLESPPILRQMGIAAEKAFAGHSDLGM